MDVSLLLKIAGIGMLTAVICQILTKSGKEEQAMYATIAGIVIVLLLLVTQIGALFTTVRSVFGI
jgi:stage III sporulation protein AC